MKKMKRFAIFTIFTLVLVLSVCLFVACNNKNDNGQTPHTHTFSREWKHDDTYHWHSGTCGHDVVADKANHEFDENYICTVCGYVDVTLHGVDLKSKTFSLDGTNISGKVSNTTDTFSFIDEISVADSATYTVSTDIKGINVIPTKTVNLVLGDNAYYIFVENGKDIRLYTVSIRRRPIYTVTFDSNGGTEVEQQQVEEDGFVIAPSSTKTGYDLSWDYDFSEPIVKDEAITASWTAIRYTITYLLDGGVNSDKNPLTYTIEDEITLLAPTKSGYTGSWLDGGKIEIGSTGDKTFTATYTANKYNLQLETDGKCYVDNDGTFDYDKPVTVTLTKLYLGYDFLGWYNGDTLCSKDHTYTFAMPANDVCLKAKTVVKDEMQIYDFSSTENTCTIEKIKNKQTQSVTIPDYVTNIGDRAFYAYSDLESVRIGNGVTSIGSDAFYGCSGLSSVTIPNSVTSIGNYAFAFCSGMTNVTIGNGVTSIGDHAFDDCSGLTNVYYTGNVESWCGISGLGNLMPNLRNLYIGGNKVEGDLIIPDSVASIAPSAFYNCWALTSITIPSGVKSIGNSAFYGCRGLTTVNWNATACESYGYPIFSGCSNLTTVNIGDKVTTIPSCAFYCCTGLTSITIPDSVTNIGFSAFYKCTNLTSITIPGSVVSIGKYAFYDCGGLTSVTIGNGVTSIGNYAFSGCKGLMTVNWNASACTSAGSWDDGSFGYYASIFNGCTNLTTVNIGENVTIIPPYAFYNRTGLTNLEIPNSVTSIGECAFYGCYKLVEVYNKSTLSITAGSSDNGYVAYYAKNVYTNESGSKLMTDENGYVIYTEGDQKILVAYTGTETELILPSCITKINQYAFWYRSGLTSITISNSVTSIGVYAFLGCNKLQDIYITDIAAWCNISGLNYLMEDASSNKNLYLNNELVTTLIIPDGVTTIPAYAFYGCSSLTSIVIPNSVTSIGSFYGCNKLQDIYITDIAAWCNISGLGNLMVYGSNNKNLYINNELATSVTIPDGVTAIPSYAFYGCSGLSSVTIPNSVTSIGNYAFAFCSGMTNVTIGNGVTSIGDRTFYNCSGLTSVTIENTVTSIGSYSFCNCSGLERIDFTGTIEQWNLISKGSDWSYNTGSYKIYCTDGTINK